MVYKTNQDSNDSIQPIVGAGFPGETHGKSSSILPDFGATRAELSILATHYEGVLLNDALSFFWFQHTGIEEIKSMKYAGRRLDGIYSILGEHEIAKTRAQADSQAKKEWGEDSWNTFLNDYSEERDRVRNEYVNNQPNEADDLP